MNKLLDRFEEFIIAALMAVATTVIFVSVVHRYLSGYEIPGLQDWLLDMNFGWAQEFCIILFVWMAKFGAAYGVRTGIHVGVDILVEKLEGTKRRVITIIAMSGGVLFTAGILGTNELIGGAAHADELPHPNVLLFVINAIYRQIVEDGSLLLDARRSDAAAAEAAAAAQQAEGSGGCDRLPGAGGSAGPP